MLNIFKRILLSKKSVLATLVVLGDAAAVWGFNVPTAEITQGAMGAFNAFGLMLVAGQSIIDAVHGSPSDRNGGGG